MLVSKPATSYICLVVLCNCFLNTPLCVLILVSVTHYSVMTTIRDVLRKVEVKVSQNTIPNIEAEVWKEVSAGLHDSREGHDDDGGVLLPLARDLGVNGGVQKEGYEFSTPIPLARGGRPLNERLQRRDLERRISTSIYLPGIYFSRGRGLDPYWPWFGGWGGGSRRLTRPAGTGGPV